MYKNLARVRMSRSKVEGQGHQGQKQRKTAESSPLTMHSKACGVPRTPYAARSSRRYHCVAAGGRGDRVTAVHADGGLRERSSGDAVLEGLASASSTPVGKSARAV